MRILMLIAMVVIGSAGFIVPGCGRGELAGPPELRPGRDECAECGMLIHDERSACSLLVEGQGRRAHLIFDDVGCVLDHERERGQELGVVGRFARDYRGGGWIAMPDAFFLLSGSDRLRTPMGSGIAAFADGPSADAAQRDFGGRVMDYAAITVARREWLGATKRGRTPGGP